MLGKILAGKKSREDEKQNRKRLDEAASASKELSAQRIADTEIKKMAASLCYEADTYIAAARKSDGAVYEPLMLQSLENALAAVNVWKKSENDAAAGKYFSINGSAGSIVVPGKTESGQSAGSNEAREKTLRILGEALREFKFHNDVRTAGDPEAAIIDLETGRYKDGSGIKRLE